MTESKMRVGYKNIFEILTWYSIKVDHQLGVSWISQSGGSIDIAVFASSEKGQFHLNNVVMMKYSYKALSCSLNTPTDPSLLSVYVALTQLPPTWKISNTLEYSYHVPTYLDTSKLDTPATIFVSGFSECHQ